MLTLAVAPLLPPLPRRVRVLAETCGKASVFALIRLQGGLKLQTPHPPALYSFRRCPYAMRARLALAVSGQQVELREVLLRDKAPELLAASPKATVPVLVLPDQVIEESYDIMLWALKMHDPENWLAGRDDGFIASVDGPFKTALDRYKYGREDEARDRAAGFLLGLDETLTQQPFLSGQCFGLADAATATFVRQFANVDRTWFNTQLWPNLSAWLENFLASPRFQAIMQKYPKWQAGTPATLFPEP